MKTRKKLNLRFLVCVLAVFAALGLGVHLVHGYQVKRNASVLLRLADKAEEDAKKAQKEEDGKEQEYRAKEMDYLARYLGFKPEDMDAKARYGVCLDEQAKKSGSPRARQSAFLQIEDVLRHNPQRDDLRKRQVKTAMYLGRYSDAEAHLVMLLKKTPEDPELIRLKARCEAANGQYDKAVESYKEAIRFAPKEIDNYRDAAVLCRSRLDADQATLATNKKVAKVDKVDYVKMANWLIEKMVEMGDPPFQAYLTRARYYLQFDSKDTNKVAQARKDLEKARKLAPNDPDVVLAVADVEQAQGKPENARKELIRGIEKHPSEVRLYLVLIALLLREDKSENNEAIKEALKYTRQGLKALQERPDKEKTDLLHALADLLVQNGELKEATETIDRLRKLKYPKPLLDYLLARIHIGKKEWGEAIKLLDEDVLPQLRRLPGMEVQALLLIGQCHEQLRNPDQAMSAYKRACKLDPLSVAAHQRLGSLLMSQGNNAEALAEFQTILTGAKTPKGIHSIVAQGLIARYRSQPSKETLEAIHRELKLIEEENEKRVRKDPKKYSVDLPILRAETILLEDPKKIDDARKVINTARDAHPDEASLWIASAQLAERSKALDILKEAQERPQLANQVELRLARIGFLTQAMVESKEDQRKQAEKELRAALGEMEEKAAKLGEEDRARLLNAIADAYRRLGETARAEDLWKQIAGLQPNNLAVRLVLFDLALFAKSTEAMDRLIEEMRGIEGEHGAYWHYAKASRLVQQALPAEKKELSEEGRRQLRDARSALFEAASRRPSWPRIPALEAEIDEVEGNINAAIDKYQQALTLGEKRPAILRKTVQLLFEQNRPDEANQLVGKLLEDEKTLLSAGLGKLAAEKLISNPELSIRDSERALDYAKMSVSKDSKDYREHLWLGRFLWASASKQKEQKEAKDSLRQAKVSLRKACELAPKVPETWVTLVAFLVSTNEKEEAKEAIKQAKDKLPSDQASLALAACYEYVGDLKKTEEYLGDARKANPKDIRTLRAAATFYIRHGQAGKAESPLRAILSLKGENSDDEDAMWARRGLAALLSSNTTRLKFDEALALLETNLTKKPSSTPDKHAKALLLATRFDRRVEAIRLFEDLDRNPLPANELFTLAQLYLAENQWEKARNTMIILLNKPEAKNPNYEAYFARSLLQHGNIAEAEAALEQLKKILPDAPLTCEIEARVCRANDRDDEALSILRDYVRKSEDANLARVGLLLEELGKNSKAQGRYLAEAEMMFRKYAEKSDKPERFLPLAVFLAHKGEIDEAVTSCEKALQDKASPEIVGQVLSKVLREGAAGDEPCGRVEKKLKEMLAQKPGSVALMICLADVYDYQKRFQNAEEVYREALRKDPDNIMALNNLAWLLAFTKPEEAVAMINKAIDRFGEGPELLDTRGVIYLKMGDFKQALKDLKEVANRAPSPTRSLHLAFALYMANQDREAMNVLDKAEKNGLDKKKLHPLDISFYDKLKG